MTRESGASSTPRPFGFHHWRLGVLDHPLSRVMTVGRTARSYATNCHWS